MHREGSRNTCPVPTRTAVGVGKGAEPAAAGGGDGGGAIPLYRHHPVKPQYYFGKNFGYIIAFKPHDGVEWRKVTVADPQAQRYTHKDPSIPPSTQFHVKVNYWRMGEDNEQAIKRVSSQENQIRLDNMKPETQYLIEVRAYNTAGCAPSRPPRIIRKKFNGPTVNIAWEQVEPLVNESSEGIVVEVRAHSPGGDGAVSQIQITANSRDL
ncbi:hypothetical protein CRUP_037365 [Coryphaenoides rupestris]|nr:hypothetical protein CRUP_037365 [Coryphaenoides rupestris]